MGCSACHECEPYTDPETPVPSHNRLSIPMSPHHHIKRGLSPTKEIKLNHSNYVIVITAKLSDLYEVQAKVGEGRE